MLSSEVLHPTVGPSLADYTNERLILSFLLGGEPTSVIQELAQVLHREGRIADVLPFYHAALNREFLSSTATGSGMAFPHARVPGLDRISMAVGRCAPPISWGPKGNPTVRLVFLVAVPATEGTEYLLLVSGLARLERERLLLDRLLQARAPLEILDLLKAIRVQPGRSSGL
jgi:mannitol/fructose-specific phosphotransferase system IIA component (Ntr-type)